MAGKPNIRTIDPAEAATALDVMIRCWTGTVSENSSAYRETTETIADDLAKGCGVVAEIDGKIVGGGRFVPVPGLSGGRDWVELKRVGVLKSHRKLGLAALMVAALEAEAMRRGYPGAQLGVRVDQPRLTVFWQSLGYVIADDVKLSNPNPLTPTPVFMRKRFAMGRRD